MCCTRIVKALLGITAGLLTFNASALETVSDQVTYIKATYLPGMAQFTLDGGSPSCPPGHYLPLQKADFANNRGRCTPR